MKLLLVHFVFNNIKTGFSRKEVVGHHTRFVQHLLEPPIATPILATAPHPWDSFPVPTLWVETLSGASVTHRYSTEASLCKEFFERWALGLQYYLFHYLDDDEDRVP